MDLPARLFDLARPGVASPLVPVPLLTNATAVRAWLPFPIEAVHQEREFGIPISHAEMGTDTM